MDSLSKIPPKDFPGKITLLDHDTEIFGFPVAEWELPRDKAKLLESAPVLKQHILDLGIRLLSCRVPTDDFLTLSAVQQMEFRVVDCTVHLISRLKMAPENPPLQLRLAQPGDSAQLEEMAAAAFTTGRYLTDPFFPRELARKRYAVWVKNALNGKIPGGVVLVADYEEEIAGFLVDKIEEDHGQCQLACINPKFRNGGLMYSLLVSHSAWQRAQGLKKASTGGISVGLMQVIKLHLAVHSQLSNSAEYVLHWHNPRFAPN